MSKVTKNKISAPLGGGLIILSSFFYASYGIWTKLMGNFFDGFTATTIRGILIVFVLGCIALYVHRLEPLNLKKNGVYIMGILLASTLNWGTLYYAILQAGVGVSLTVAYAAIVIGMFFFGWLFAGEHFTKNKMIAGLLGILGLVCIFSPSITNFGWIALLAAAVSGFTTAINTVLCKKIHYAPTQSTLVLWAATAIANFLMAFFLHKSYPAFHWQIQWVYLIIFSVVSLAASWALIKGVKLIDAGTAGILGLLEIVFGVLFGMIFFSERPGGIVVAGIILILIAAAIPYVQEFNIKRAIIY